jgi:hypothetical protein
MIKQTKKTSLEIKAPQAIVHVKHTITLRQYKLWVILLQRYRDAFEANEEPDKHGFLRISKSELTGFLGYEPVKEELKNDFEKLRREPIIVNYLEKDGTAVMHGMGFLSEWKVSTKAIRFKVPSLLQEVMQGLDQPRAIFQLINWDIFNHFTGKHESVIYKLCRDYVGVKKTPYMTLEEFKEYMGLKQEEYKEFMDLNKWVIKNSLKKINLSELSDITVDVAFKRDGRKVLGLYFVVERKKQQSIPFPELEENPAFKFAKITIQASTQAEYLALRSPEEITLCIERANEYGEELSKKGKDAPNYGGLYRKAITEGWHTAMVEKTIKKEAKEKQIQQEKQAEELKSKAQNMKAEEEEKRKLDLLSEFHSLDEKEQEGIRAIFEKQSITFVSNAWKKAKEKSSTPENEPRFKVDFVKFYETYKANLRLDV